MTIPRPGTHQFNAFTTNLAYARKMVNAGKYLAPFRSPEIDVDDFYRAAWVQTVAAIDHWFHEELFSRVGLLASKDSSDMPVQLRGFELPLHRIEAVSQGDLTLSDAVVEHVRDKWGNASLQNPRKISEALKLVTEKNVWRGAAAQLNTWHGHRTSHTEQSLKRRFSSITDRRNKIAHEADLLAGGELTQRRPLTHAEVSDAIDWIDRVALAIAYVLDE